MGSLFFSGFGLLPYFFAILCVRMRLLPKGHRFFHAHEKYGIRHVLAESANYIQFKWRNIDQILVYAALVCGAAVLFAFIAALLFYILLSTPVAHAAIPWISDIFVTAQPDKDVAFMMLDRVLGVPGIYDSAIITQPAIYGPIPNVFHDALLTLFSFFSFGLFLIAVFIFLYFVVEIIWDITQTGSPLGETLHNTWIPLRLVAAFGLLIPISGGLNTAQYITLYTAKFGSGLATNAWGMYNMDIGLNPTGFGNENLLAEVGYQDVTNLLRGLLVMKACQEMNRYAHSSAAASGSLANVDGTGDDGTLGYYSIKPYIVSSTDGRPLLTNGILTGVLASVGEVYEPTPYGVVSGDAGDAFTQVLQASNLSGIRLVMGYKNPDDPLRYKEYPGGVLPVCGEVYIPVNGYNAESLLAAEAYFYATLYVLTNQKRPGATLSQIELDSDLAVFREYARNSPEWQNAMNFFRSAYGDNRECLYDQNLDGYESLDEGSGDGGASMGHCMSSVPEEYWSSYMGTVAQAFVFHPAEVARAAISGLPNQIDQYSIGDATYTSMGLSDPMMFDALMFQLGWGGAGLWYNKISEKNGSYVSAVSGIPVIQKMPITMEKIKDQRAKNNTVVEKGFCGQYRLNKSGTDSIKVTNEKSQFEAELAENLYKTCKVLFENQNILADVYDGSTFVFAVNNSNYSNNPVERAMALVFGEFQIFNIYENQDYGVLPMAQLSAMGKLLVDKSMMAMMAAIGSSAMGGLMHMAAASSQGDDIEALNMLGSAFGEFAGAAVSFATLGLTTGVMLHYVLPFLPFMYFFFAVGRWVKTIFEALVGVPLWALAHMRLSGEGLPGEAASSGYFLLLEIFVRPILTIISLIASFAVFNAMVTVMNSIFTLLVTNFSGVSYLGYINADPDVIENFRGVADQFFYTIMYVVLTYMIGTSCFKLIDIIPDNILGRWSGAGVSSLGASDNADDLIDQLQSQMPIMVSHFTTKIGKGIQETLYKPAAALGRKAEIEFVQVREKAAKQIMEVAKHKDVVTHTDTLNATKDIEYSVRESAIKALIKSGQLEVTAGGYKLGPKAKGN